MAAFEAAAKVLPKVLQDAIQSRVLRNIEEALHAHERTYRIFPEREPEQVAQLASTAVQLAAALRKEVLESLDELLASALAEGVDKATALDRISTDASLIPGIRDTACEQLAPLVKDQALRDKVGLAKLLAQHQGVADEIAQLELVLLHCTAATWGVRQLAIKRLKTARAEKESERLLAQTGCVSVEAVIKALPRVLAQARASGDMMEIEHTLGNLRVTMRLAEERNILCPPETAALCGELQADYDKKVALEGVTVSNAIDAAMESAAVTLEAEPSRDGAAAAAALEDALGMWNSGHCQAASSEWRGMAIRFVAITTVQQDSERMAPKQKQLLDQAICNLEYQFEQNFCAAMREQHTAVIESLCVDTPQQKLLGHLKSVVADDLQPRGVRSISQEQVELLELHGWVLRLEAAMKGAEPMLQCLDALCEDYRDGLPSELTVLQHKAKMVLMRNLSHGPKAAPKIIKRSKRKEYTRAFVEAKQHTAEVGTKMGGMWKKKAHEQREEKDVLGAFQSKGDERKVRAGAASGLWKKKAHEKREEKEVLAMITQVVEQGDHVKEVASSVSLKWKVRADQHRQKEAAMQQFLAREARQRAVEEEHAARVLAALHDRSAETRQRAVSFSGLLKRKSQQTKEEERKKVERDEAKLSALGENALHVFKSAAEERNGLATNASQMWKAHAHNASAALNSADVLRAQLTQMTVPVVKANTFYETMVQVAAKRQAFREAVSASAERRKKLNARLNK